ncbi:MAG: hypothetical protein OXF75_09465 [Acidimicrobiaceae bacterium]|nr:hypothetical protein [Acidimicrobiaceae bacterium]
MAGRQTTLNAMEARCTILALVVPSLVAILATVLDFSAARFA